MYSQVENFLGDADFWKIGNIKVALHAFAIVWCLGFFLKHAFKRKKYLEMFPSRKVSLFNIWGNTLDFYTNRRTKRLTFTVYVLQVLMGYKQIFKHDPYFYFGFSYIPMLVLVKARSVEDLLSGSRNIKKNWTYDWLYPWLGTGLLTSYGSKWKSQRKLLTPSFHFDILRDFLPVLNEQSHLLVKLLEKQTKSPWTDIVHPITLCSLDIVCETTLGVTVGAQRNSESEYVQAVSRACEMFMKRWIHPPYFLDWYFNLSSVGTQFKKDVKLLHDFTRKVIFDKKEKLLSCKEETSEKEEYSRKKRKSFMDLLLEEHIKNDALTEEGIREEVDTFVFAGHDTTSTSISWALYLIGLYKDVQEKVHEEIDHVFGTDLERPVTTDDLKELEYFDRVIKECQRIYPPVPFFSRDLSEDTTICGTKVPKEFGVLVFIYALHRDETAFPNPEKFDPDRFLPENSANRSPFAYIPFSAGPRNCIGQRFAMMEIKVVILNILRNYRLESLDPRDKVIPIPELVLRSAVPIRIKLRSRRPTM